MPAADEEFAITKLVTVHPDNVRQSLPTIQSEMIVAEAGTGVRLGLLEGSTVTARRTAALSLLATQTLARRPDGPLLIVGAGTQGRAHLEAFHEGLGISKIFLVSRTEERTHSLVEHAQSLGIEAEVASSVEQVLDKVSLIVTATTSHEPVLPDYIPADTFVAAVGAFNPEMAELPPTFALQIHRGGRYFGRRKRRSGRPHTSSKSRRFRVGKSHAARRCSSVDGPPQWSNNLQERRQRALGPRRRPHGFLPPLRA